MEIINIFFIFIISYFLGSIPTAYIVSKFKGIDIRKVGSGNIGAANVLRNVGKKEGIIVLLGDILKGFVPVMFLSKISFGINSDILKILTGTGAIIGHLFPIFLKFKGGKIVATNLGVFLAIDPVITFITFFILLGIAKISRYLSLGSLVSSLCLTSMLFIKYGMYYFSVFAVCTTIIIFIRHISNIKRLIQGKENKI